eukprot:1158458-Pelagomonas_calceolata.AAC.13
MRATQGTCTHSPCAQSRACHTGNMHSLTMRTHSPCVQVDACHTGNMHSPCVVAKSCVPYKDYELTRHACLFMRVTQRELALTRHVCKPCMPHREHALTAAMKLTARYPSEVSRLKTLLTKHNRSPALEVQSRSTEYTTMFKMDPAVRTQLTTTHTQHAYTRAHTCNTPVYDNCVKPFFVWVRALRLVQLLERMPALNESEYYRNLGVEMKPIGAGANAKPAVSTQIANDLLGDLEREGDGHGLAFSQQGHPGSAEEVPTRPKTGCFSSRHCLHACTSSLPARAVTGSFTGNWESGRLAAWMDWNLAKPEESCLQRGYPSHQFDPLDSVRFRSQLIEDGPPNSLRSMACVRSAFLYITVSAAQLWLLDKGNWQAEQGVCLGERDHAWYAHCLDGNSEHQVLQNTVARELPLNQLLLRLPSGSLSCASCLPADAPESSTAPTTSKANNDLEELLGGGPSVAPASAAASAAPAASQPQQVDLCVLRV